MNIWMETSKENIHSNHQHFLSSKLQGTAHSGLMSSLLFSPLKYCNKMYFMMNWRLCPKTFNRTSGWRDPAASSWGAAPSCWAGCGGPAAGRQTASAWPGPALWPCGLSSLGRCGPDSLLHPPGSWTGTVTREWGQRIKPENSILFCSLWRALFYVEKDIHISHW